MGTRGPKPGSGGRPKKAIADKLADRIAGAIVDLAYRLEENPRLADQKDFDLF